MLQCVAVACSLLQCVVDRVYALILAAHCVVVCCSVVVFRSGLQCVAECCSVLPMGVRADVSCTLCCSVLQCVAVCCSVLLTCI